MLDSLQDQVWQAVAKSRNIGVDALDELADRAPLLRDDAVTCGLIDRIGFRDQAYARMAELVGVEKVHRNPVARKQAQTKSRRGCTWRATPVRPGHG